MIHNRMTTIQQVLEMHDIMGIILKEAMMGRKYIISYIPYGDGEQTYTHFRYYPPVPLVCLEWKCTICSDERR